MRRLLLAFAVIPLVLGCGAEPAPVVSGTDREPEATGSPEITTPRGPGYDRPPDVVVEMGSEDLALSPWTWCYGSTCVDGIPPDEPPDVGSRSDVRFTFAETGWEFEATFTQSDTKCPRSITIPVDQQGDTYILGPAGPPGAWDVNLVGRGGGDVITTFRWATTEEGEMPEPKAHLGLLADNDGALDSYGLELSISDMAAYEGTPTAEITVTAAGGESLTFEARKRSACGGSGSVFFNGPDAKGHEAAELGEAPFTYEVRLTLGDVVHVGTGTYPDDLIEDWHPYVALTFDPPLPTYTG